VFLHGWPDSWFSFSRVLPALPKQLRALVIDQRGFGDSDRPESGYAIPDLAADVLAFLDALSIDRATLIGHSFGTFVARCVAIAQPERVARLVLIGTGFTQSNPVVGELQTALHDLPDPVPLQFARDFQASTVYRSVPTEFFDRIVAESLKLPARLWREMIDRLTEYADAERLSEIAAPTLLLWGDKDALFPQADQDRLVAALRGAKLIVYGETGHCPNWERPERVAADIAAFVQRT
jgi:pimeloyl-ACP methyl ester carboxylesterase